MGLLLSKKRLKQAYDAVFSDGHRSGLDIQLVLNDIINKTLVNKTINGDTNECMRKLGKRDIGLHIQNMLDLDMSYFTKLDADLKRKDREIKL